MCLAIPGQIINIKDDYADINFGGVSKRASLRLCKNAKVDDYVLVHAGFVIQILDKDDGQELDNLIKEIME